LEPSAEITAQLAQIRAEGLHGTPLPPLPLTRRGVDVLGPGFDHLAQKSARIYRKMHIQNHLAGLPILLENRVQ
jgi:hypothetical protein